MGLWIGQEEKKIWFPILWQIVGVFFSGRGHLLTEGFVSQLFASQQLLVSGGVARGKGFLFKLAQFFFSATPCILCIVQRQYILDVYCIIYVLCFNVSFIAQMIVSWCAMSSCIFFVSAGSIGCVSVTAPAPAPEGRLLPPLAPVHGGTRCVLRHPKDVPTRGLCLCHS